MTFSDLVRQCCRSEYGTEKSMVLEVFEPVFACAATSLYLPKSVFLASEEFLRSFLSTDGPRFSRACLSALEILVVGP